MKIKPILLAIVLFSIFSMSSVNAWWDANYVYRRTITITNSLLQNSWWPIIVNTTPLTNFNADLSDFRAVHSDDTTALTYSYAFKDSTNTYALFKVKPLTSISTPYVPYVYYGCAGCTNSSTSIYNITAHYGFDGGSGVTMLSDDTLVYNLTMTGTVRPTTNAQGCPFGNCYYFNAAAANFLSATATIKQGYTLCAWVNKTGDHANGEFAVTIPGNVGGGEYMAIGDLQGGGVTGLQCSTPKAVWASGEMANNKWYFICCVWDGSYLAMYVNGSQKTSWDAINTIKYNAQTMLVGEWNPAGYAPWDGGVDEISIINSTYPDVRNSVVINQTMMSLYQSYNASNFILGSEENNGGVILTLTSPTNTTYPSNSITVSGSTDSLATVYYSMNGNSNVTACTNCYSFSTSTSTNVNEGGNHIRVYAVNGTFQNSKNVTFSVDTKPPQIFIQQPANNTNISSLTNVKFNYTAIDAGIGLGNCTYLFDGGTVTHLANCQNFTANLTTHGLRNIILTANDTLNNTNQTTSYFFLDPLNEFRLRDNKTGNYVNNFQVLFIGDNATRSTTNGSLLFTSYSVTFGTQLLRVAAAGYNTSDYTYTFNATTLYNDTLDLYPASLRIIAYDEDDAYAGISTNLTFDINLANTTYSVNFYNQTEFFAYWNQTPTGTQVITTVSATGYTSRRYYITINENTALKLNAYLPKISNSWLVRFSIRNQLDTVIPEALCTATRFFNGSYQEVGQEISDISGTCAITLNPFAIYKIKVEKGGYVTQYATLQPSSQDYRIYLTSPSSLGFSTVLTNVSMRLLPDQLGLNATENIFSCAVSSTISDLEYIGFNISNSTHVLYYNYLDTSPSGTEFIQVIDLTGKTGNLNARCFFKKTGFSEFNLTYTYYFKTYTEGEQSLPSIFRNFGNLGYSPITTGIIALIISGLVGGFVSTRNGLAGALTVLIMLALFTFWLAWFDWRVYMLVLMTVISAIFLRSGV